MITITCDMCGKKLEQLYNLVKLHLNQDDPFNDWMDNKIRDIEKQLCPACAKQVLAYVDKGGDNDA